MFKNSIKSVLAVAVVATGAAFSTSTANAGGNFGVYIGNGHGNGVYFNNHGGHNPGYFSHGHRKRKCNPRRALNKAYRMGVNRPHVTRVNHKKIVVKGFTHGHRAKVVFKRQSKHCRVLNTRGLYY